MNSIIELYNKLANEIEDGKPAENELPVDSEEVKEDGKPPAGEAPVVDTQDTVLDMDTEAAPEQVETKVVAEGPAEGSKEPQVTDAEVETGELAKAAEEIGRLLIQDYLADIALEQTKVAAELLENEGVIALKMSEVAEALSDKSIPPKEAAEIAEIIDTTLAEITGVTPDSLDKVAGELIESDATLLLHPELGVIGIVEG